MSARRLALVIANGHYTEPSLRGLRSPLADAAALVEVLQDPAISGFTVTVVRDAAAHEVLAAIEEHLTTARPDDLVLMHFSGHGLKDESGALYLAASNTRPDRLRSTAVPAEFIQHTMHTCRARRLVLLLDCCYGGAFGRGVRVRASGSVNVLESFPAERMGGGRGRVVISASSSMAFAFEGDRLADGQVSLSLFTQALVTGLRTGEADLDGDGLIGLDELYDYVFDKVREQNPRQSPTRLVDLEGDLYLARSVLGARAAEPPPVTATVLPLTATGPPTARQGPGRAGRGPGWGIVAAALLQAVAVVLLAVTAWLAFLYDEPLRTTFPGLWVMSVGVLLLCAVAAVLLVRVGRRPGGEARAVGLGVAAGVAAVNLLGWLVWIRAVEDGDGTGLGVFAVACAAALAGGGLGLHSLARQGELSWSVSRLRSAEGIVVCVGAVLGAAGLGAQFAVTSPWDVPGRVWAVFVTAVLTLAVPPLATATTTSAGGLGRWLLVGWLLVPVTVTVAGWPWWSARDQVYRVEDFPTYAAGVVLVAVSVAVLITGPAITRRFRSPAAPGRA